jgi:hypothetical protein
MWTKNYKIDTKHDIGWVVAEGMREGEVDGLIPNNRVVREKFRDLHFDVDGLALQEFT